MQLLILGAGLDLSYDNYFDETYNIDFADIITQRKSIKSMKNNILISADLRNYDDLIKKLISANFNFMKETIIIAECVFIYIDQIYVVKLLAGLASVLKNATILTYDPLFPSNGNSNHNIFMDDLLKKFMKRGAPFPTVHSLQEQLNMFVDCGWKHVCCSNLNDAICTFLNTADNSFHPDSELFDEFSSLAIIRKNYSFTIASLKQEDFQSCWNLIVNKNIDFKPVEDISAPCPCHCQCCCNRLKSLWSRIRSAERRLQSLLRPSRLDVSGAMRCESAAQGRRMARRWQSCCCRGSRISCRSIPQCGNTSPRRLRD